LAGFQQLCGTTNDTPLRYVRRSKSGIHREMGLSIKDWQALARVNGREHAELSKEFGCHATNILSSARQADEASGCM
jgi:hypothetical protein